MSRILYHRAPRTQKVPGFEQEGCCLVHGVVVSQPVAAAPYGTGFRTSMLLSMEPCLPMVSRPRGMFWFIIILGGLAHNSIPRGLIRNGFISNQVGSGHGCIFRDLSESHCVFMKKSSCWCIWWLEGASEREYTSCTNQNPPTKFNRAMIVGKYFIGDHQSEFGTTDPNSTFT